jgi:3-oxoacyl-[acyl-carrier protein] reductase
MLEKKVALITGASRGIGSEIARTLAREGIFVIINYNGSKERATVLAEEINAMVKEKFVSDSGKSADSEGNDEAAAVIFGCDVSDYAACQNMIQELIKTYGHIDILVNNAGITRDGLLMKMSEEDFDCVLETNLKGAFNTIRHMSRHFLKQRSGRIINISSVSGVMGNAGQANYSASKAGVIGLTKSVARELASRGITCNAVAPGFIETEMTEAMPEAAKEAVKAQIPLQRTGSVKDVAETVAFLASEKASYITGQVISVDGGMHM